MVKKQKNIDIISELQKVVCEKVEYFQEDFEQDIRLLTEACDNPDPEDRRFLWLARKCGTWLFPERDTFIKGSTAYNTWMYYESVGSEKYRAFAIRVKELQDGRVIGDIEEIDYLQQCEIVREYCVAPAEDVLVFEKGTISKSDYLLYRGDYGKFITFKTMPRDPELLEEVLRNERKLRVVC